MIVGAKRLNDGDTLVKADGHKAPPKPLEESISWRKACFLPTQALLYYLTL